VPPAADALRGQLRVAVRADVAGIQRVRHAVRENRLVSRTISDAEVIHAIERSGRGWVVEVDGEVVGFAIGNIENASVWALFVDPLHAGQGHGRALHQAMIEWMRQSGCLKLSLLTDPGTRAQRFYGRAGWRSCGLLENGELLMELE
jgi:GNAT superfamily N-acetyltransferase